MGRRIKEKNLISRLLVSTDFSDCSAAALQYAIALAKRMKAHLILVHVIEPSDHLAEGLPFINDREHLLDNLSKEALKEKIPVDVQLLHGGPIDEIIHSANREKADLIVLGTHGKADMKHLFTECVAEKLMESAPCPVVTVRPRPAHSKRRTTKIDLE